jgi:glycosyltransferase involved in cell wall biosynthesis
LAGWAAWDTLPTAGVDETALDADLSIIIPCLNESAAIEQTLALVAGGGGSGRSSSGDNKTSVSPPPLEIIVVDGGSTDGTPDLAERYAKRHNREVDRVEKEQQQRQRHRRRDNDDEQQQQPPQPPLPPRIQILRLNRRGRAVQMNAGAALARAPLLAFLHADTQPPLDLVAAARRWFLDRRNVALGFVPSIEVDEERMERRRTTAADGAGEIDERTKNRRSHLLVAQSAHNTIKTLFYPALLRPLSFLRGLRLLFGDQVIVVRRADLERVGGFDERYRIMEDADLCLRLHKAGPYVGGTEVAAKQQKTKKPLSEIDRCRLAFSTWQNQTTEQAFQPAPWQQPRGRVRMDCRRLARTSGRRLAAWGFLRGSITNFRIASAWYFWHSPERVADLYRRLYTDAYR